MEKLLILLLAIGVAIFIALPFFRNKFREKYYEESEISPNPVSTRLKKLNFEKESLLSVIKEIEFDYKLGKLSKEDYEELEIKYKTQAALLLKEIAEAEQKTGASDLESDVEKEIKLARGTKSSEFSDDEEIEIEILIFRKTELFCPKCGNNYQHKDVFCSKCGAKLNESTS